MCKDNNKKRYRKEYYRKKRQEALDKKLYTRECPDCKGEILYSTKRSLIVAIGKNTQCDECRPNGFQDKTHTEETKDKIRNHPNQKIVHSHTNYKNRNMPNGKDHHFTGSSFIQHWKDKYGEEMAIELLDEYKKLKSRQNSGEGNPMYGRPSPRGSGNGISGWFNGMFFRSLLELNFLVTCHKLNYDVRSAECKEFRVEYPDINFTRNYYPDFILNEKYVVECKPQRLTQTINNQAKFKAAVNKWGTDIFKVISPPKFDIQRIPQLIDVGLLKLTNRSEKYLRTKRKLDI